MRVRSCRAFFFAIIALFFSAFSGYSGKLENQAKPAAKPKTGKLTPPPQPELSFERQYKVRSGDCLGAIARKFGTTTKAIQAANGLKSNRIKAGQILIIPAAKDAKNASLKNKDSRPLEIQRDPNETYISAAPIQSMDTTEPEGSTTRLQLVQAGFQLIGVKYRFGGSGNSGFDCSGLVKNLFSKFNIDLPRSSREQFKQGQQVPRDELEPGDLVFFSSGGSQPTHVGIYIGHDKMLHAARKAKQVIVTDINKLWYTMRYLGARRIADLWSDEPPQESKE